MSWLSHELFIPLQWCYISKWSAVCLLGKRRAKNVVFHTRILIGTRGLADIVHRCKEFLASYSHSPHASQNEAILATVFRLVETFTSQIRLLGEVWVLKPCNGIMRVKCCQNPRISNLQIQPKLICEDGRNGTGIVQEWYEAYWYSELLALTPSHSLFPNHSWESAETYVPDSCPLSLNADPQLSWTQHCLI